MKVLLLAGGFATRLWPLTEKRAKPLLLLEGETILAHILKKIPDSAELFLLTNQCFEADFLKELKYLGRKHFSIFCEDAYSDGEKLGALRAISYAVKEFALDENIFVCAGDNLLPDLEITDLACGEKEACLAVRKVDSLHEAKKFGVVEVNEEWRMKNEELKGKIQVKDFEEKPEEPKSTLVSTGFFALGKGLFPLLHTFAQDAPDALGGIFPKLLQENIRVLAHEIKGEWFDVGSFETYLEAHKKLQTLSLQKGKNVQETENTFSGKVFLGQNSTVKNCVLTDSIIYPYCQLENCHISQSIIDENCVLKELDLNRKLVRKGTKLMSNPCFVKTLQDK